MRAVGSPIAGAFWSPMSAGVSPIPRSEAGDDPEAVAAPSYDSYFFYDAGPAIASLAGSPRHFLATQGCYSYTESLLLKELI